MERRVLLEDLQAQVVSCMLNVLKLSPRTVYGQSSAYMKAVLDCCAKHGEKYYNPVLLNKFWAETEARYKRGEITKGHYLGKRKCLERLAECYNTGTLSWTLHKSKQKYRLSDEAQALLDEFLQTLVRDANTTYDYSRVVRRYLNYLRGIGITDVTFIRQTDQAAFILSCAMEVTRGSMRNMQLMATFGIWLCLAYGTLRIAFEPVYVFSEWIPDDLASFSIYVDILTNVLGVVCFVGYQNGCDNSCAEIWSLDPDRLLVTHVCSWHFYSTSTL